MFSNRLGFSDSRFARSRLFYIACCEIDGSDSRAILSPEASPGHVIIIIGPEGRTNAASPAGTSLTQSCLAGLNPVPGGIGSRSPRGDKLIQKINSLLECQVSNKPSSRQGYTYLWALARVCGSCTWHGRERRIATRRWRPDRVIKTSVTRPKRFRWPDAVPPRDLEPEAG